MRFIEDRESILTYAGEVRYDKHGHNRCFYMLNQIAGSGSNSRHVSREFFPVLGTSFSTWVIPVAKFRSPSKIHGIGIHLAHVDNERNLLLMAVRGDGRMKISSEFDDEQYKDLRFGDGLDFNLEQRYFIRAKIDVSGHVSLEVNSNRKKAIVVTSYDIAMLPSYGQVGLRLDGYDCLVGPWAIDTSY